MKTTFFAGSLVFLALVAFPVLGQSDDETAAKAAEQAGKYQVALQQYTAALAKAQEGSADDQRIREAIIRVAQRMSPRPVIPEEARNRMIRGRAAFKLAKSPADMKDAIDEFRRAVNSAPWLGESYFNLALALEKAENYPEAIRNYKLYLLAEPSQKESASVRDKVVELEYLQERTQKERLEQQQALARAKADEDAKFGHLLGNWQFESSTQWGQEMNVKLIGTLTFTHQGDAVEGRVQSRGVYFNRDYSASDDQTPKPELRGTFRRETNTIEWVSARSFPAGNCYRPVEWRPVMIQVGPDRRRITYSTPQSSLHHQTCAATSQTTRFVTLTR
jgi:tetratricopeptide (TPR) repeat protein